jgi:RimJ/RimL family protein N-acetyltransferase
VFDPEFPIETERLLLRPFEPGDLNALADIYKRAEVSRYLYGQPVDDGGAAAKLAKFMTETALAAEGDRIRLAIVPDDVGYVVGDVNLLWRSETHEQGEIGYVLHPDHHGYGYATEAALEMLGLGFDGYEFHRIVGHLDARNEASAAVLRRLGMRREAHLIESEFVKGEWVDEVIFALIDLEWDEAQS